MPRDPFSAIERRESVMRRLFPAPVLLFTGIGMANAETLHLYAAGSLKRALGDVAETYAAATGDRVETAFGASGLMRQRIENGETAHVFASANTKHPRALEEQGRGGPVRLFARNRLCAIARPDVAATSDTLLNVLLDADIRLGTSTPKADPSGDYAWELFRKADKVRPGAFETLDAKAMKLTGGPDTEKAPDGRNQYGWVMGEKKADVFLTYCTNAVLAREEIPELQIITIPSDLSVGADYGLMVLAGAPERAWNLADHILSEEGQKILAAYGFETNAGGG